MSLAPSGFDAQFSALWRRYSHRIADGVGQHDPTSRGTTLWYSKPFDVERMNDDDVELRVRADVTRARPR